VSSMDSIRKMILDDTGHTVEELFETFDPVPIGAASLAQVHRATLKGGQEYIRHRLSLADANMLL
jgi:aarF domain-containing kinase